MNGHAKAEIFTRDARHSGSAEQRLRELGIGLPKPPEPVGIYVEAVQTGNVDAYLKWQAWMRQKQPRLLVIWGKHDLSFDGGEPENRVDGPQAAGTGDGGRVIVDGEPVSTGREARITDAGDIRFFAGWRKRPFLLRRGRREEQPAVHGRRFLR